MKKLLFIFVILFSLQASANHHRAHALFFLNDTDGRVGWARNLDYVDMKLVPTFANPTAQIHYNTLGAQLDGLRVKILEIETEIYASTDCSAYDVDLFLTSIRFQMNQPTKLDRSFADQALLLRISSTMYTVGQLLGTAGPGELDIVVTSTLIRRLSEAWQNAEFVLWHVNDAYREEVINLPAFGAGHDPLIDPAGFGQAYIYNPCGN